MFITCFGGMTLFSVTTPQTRHGHYWSLARVFKYLPYELQSSWFLARPPYQQCEREHQIWIPHFCFSWIHGGATAQILHHNNCVANSGKWHSDLLDCRNHLSLDLLFPFVLCWCKVYILPYAVVIGGTQPLAWHIRQPRTCLSTECLLECPF